MTLELTQLAQKWMTEYPSDFQAGANAQDLIQQDLPAGDRADRIWGFIQTNDEIELSPQDYAFLIGQHFGKL